MYDSAVFREEDFDGLFSFGGGSKKYDPTSTGMFGLGFNSVYHLTDSPTFISGESHVSVSYSSWTRVHSVARALRTNVSALKCRLPGHSGPNAGLLPWAQRVGPARQPEHLCGGAGPPGAAGPVCPV